MNLTIMDLATADGCKEYLTILLDSMDELDNDGLAFAIALKSAIRFIDCFKVYQRKYGKLELKDLAENEESDI